MPPKDGINDVHANQRKENCPIATLRDIIKKLKANLTEVMKNIAETDSKMDISKVFSGYGKCYRRQEKSLFCLNRLASVIISQANW